MEKDIFLRGNNLYNMYGMQQVSRNESCFHKYSLCILFNYSMFSFLDSNPKLPMCLKSGESFRDYWLSIHHSWLVYIKKFVFFKPMMIRLWKCCITNLHRGQLFLLIGTICSLMPLLTNRLVVLTELNK